MSNKIVSYFHGSDMRCSFEGLAEISKKEGKDPAKLKDGQFIVHLNNARTMGAIVAGANVFLKVRAEGRRRLLLGALNKLPYYFGGGKFDYEGAVKETIEEDFKGYVDSYPERKKAEKKKTAKKKK